MTVENIDHEILSTAITRKTRLFKYTENFTTKKSENFQRKKNADIFHISAQNIDCGYSLEPPRRGGSKKVKIFREKCYFSYFCSKHRLWVLVRTASTKRF